MGHKNVTVAAVVIIVVQLRACVTYIGGASVVRQPADVFVSSLVVVDGTSACVGSGCQLEGFFF